MVRNGQLQGLGMYSFASLERVRTRDTQEEVGEDLSAVGAPPVVSTRSMREVLAQRCPERCFENLVRDVCRLGWAMAHDKVVLPAKPVSLLTGFRLRDNKV